jgi:polysaccharide biosynthesis/export protein ExoF
MPTTGDIAAALHLHDFGVGHCPPAMVRRKSNMPTTCHFCRLAILVAVAGAISLVLSPAFANPPGQGTIVEQQSLERNDNTHDTSGKPAKNPLTVGDRLKIAFFETLDLSGKRGGGADSNQSSIKTFYPRMDLTGDYSVDPSGFITLPRLGRFEASGRSVLEFEAELSAAFVRLMERPVEVNLTIVERLPIYVVGQVRAPGSFKHVPGMIVMQALALSGGTESTAGTTAQLIESVREIEKLQLATLQLKRLLARRARLEAERDGSSEIRTPARLVDLSGEQSAEVLLKAERAILISDRLARQRQLDEQTAAIKHARNELNALKRRLAQLDSQLELRTERLSDLQRLTGQGHATRSSVISVRTEMSDIEARRQDHLLSIVQVEARLQASEDARTRLTTEAAVNLPKFIAQIDGEIAEAARAVATAELVTAILKERNGSEILEAGVESVLRPAFEIVRHSPQGTTISPANEMSLLEPGDVLRIATKSRKRQTRETVANEPT